MDDDLHWDETLIRLKIRVNSLGSQSINEPDLQNDERMYTDFGYVQLVYAKYKQYGSHTTEPYSDPDDDYSGSNCVGLCVNTNSWDTYDLAYNNFNLYVSVSWVSTGGGFY